MSFDDDDDDDELMLEALAAAEATTSAPAAPAQPPHARPEQPPSAAGHPPLPHPPPPHAPPPHAAPPPPAARPHAATPHPSLPAPSPPPRARAGPPPPAHLAALNEQQLAAATAPFDSPLLLLAGAGAGKTLTLMKRIVHAVRSGAFAPGRILALTFTRNAAAELGQRVRAELGHDVRCSTFHKVSGSFSVTDLGSGAQPPTAVKAPRMRNAPTHPSPPGRRGSCDVDIDRAARLPLSLVGARRENRAGGRARPAGFARVVSTFDRCSMRVVRRRPIATFASQGSKASSSAN